MNCSIATNQAICSAGIIFTLKSLLYHLSAHFNGTFCLYISGYDWHVVPQGLSNFIHYSPWWCKPTVLESPVKFQVFEIRRGRKNHMIGKWDSVRFQLLHTTVVLTTTARFTAWCYTSHSFENRQIEAIKKGCSNILQNLAIPSENISRKRM